MRLRGAVNDTVEYLKENFRRHVALDELSSRIFFSKDYLKRIFHELMGMPVGAYLQKLRIDEAARLLREPDKTVTDIAELSGFVDVKTFYTVFRGKWTSPSASTEAPTVRRFAHPTISLERTDFQNNSTRVSLKPLLV